VNLFADRTYTFQRRLAAERRTRTFSASSERRRTSIAGSVSLTYGNYAAQPDIGYLTRREACWVAVQSGSRRTGSSRRRPLDLAANKITICCRRRYVTIASAPRRLCDSYSYADGHHAAVLSHAYMLQTPADACHTSRVEPGRRSQ